MGPYVDVEITTERGEKLPVSFFVSMPSIPDGTLNVRKGDIIRFSVYPWNGTVTFPKEGKYRLKARLSATARDGGDPVSFQTNEREFTVIFENEKAS